MARPLPAAALCAGVDLEQAAALARAGRSAHRHDLHCQTRMSLSSHDRMVFRAAVLAGLTAAVLAVPMILAWSHAPLALRALFSVSAGLCAIAAYCIELRALRTAARIGAGAGRAGGLLVELKNGLARW
jgi:hypothetical protein